MSSLQENLFFILVEPIYAGNVGAVARILNNFGCSNLRIVGSVPHKNDFYLAMHSEHIIEDAAIFPTLKEAMADMDRVIAFSRRLGKLKPVDMNPWDMADYVQDNPQLKTALVFGRETYGLTDEEADLCPLRCHIPANPAFPSLNLAQAVALAAWEIWSQPDRHRDVKQAEGGNHTIKTGMKSNAVGKDELDKLQNYMTEVLASIGFFHDFEPVNWEQFFTRMLHQLNPAGDMVYRFRQLFNRIHVLFHGRGKGY